MAPYLYCLTLANCLNLASIIINNQVDILIKIGKIFCVYFNTEKYFLYFNIEFVHLFEFYCLFKLIFYFDLTSIIVKVSHHTFEGMEKNIFLTEVQILTLSPSLHC